MPNKVDFALFNLAKVAFTSSSLAKSLTQAIMVENIDIALNR